MKVTFLGAAREVTGSMHLLETAQDRVLLDCGLFQGRRKESERKNRFFPVDPRTITTLMLSHAHIDHCGRVPLLTRQHFAGRIVCTRATADACAYLLLDSAHIQESDADYLNYKSLRGFLSQMQSGAYSRKNRSEIKKILKKDRHQIDRQTVEELMASFHLEAVAPLYRTADAEHALTFIDGFPYRHSIRIGSDLTGTFYDAGHILGSAMIIVKHQPAGGPSVRVGFSGDIGRFGKPILRDPTVSFAEEDRRLDLLIMESTYGGRRHAPVADLKPRLEAVLKDAAHRSGSVIIPSFAFGRTQDILYFLHELYDERRVPRIPVYVDSPLATRLTRVFGEHPELYDQAAHQAFLEKGLNPFSFQDLQFITTVEESMTLMRSEKPHIVIAGSGMCEGGRVLHHLRHKIHNPSHTILIVGFMAQHTLGRRILEKGLEYAAAGRKGAAPMLKFLNKEYPLQARVVHLDGFSAHADSVEMLKFLKSANLSVRRVAVVHGEADQAMAFADRLHQAGYAAQVPRPGESIALPPAP